MQLHATCCRKHHCCKQAESWPGRHRAAAGRAAWIPCPTVPGRGLGQLLAGQLPRYQPIVLAGHSFGGGEAVFIASVRAVAGVVMLASPPFLGSIGPGSWVARLRAGPIPLDRYIGFIHSGDPFYMFATAGWRTMGLPAFGALTSADHIAAPYRNAAKDVVHIDRHGPLCRRHHRCKQAQGSAARQPQPGVLVGQLPHGRTYTVRPDRYPV
jgi:hypothetical protein